MENFNLIDEKDFAKLSENFIKNLDGREVLEAVHPKLRTIYDNRAYQYQDDKELQDKLSKSSKI